MACDISRRESKVRKFSNFPNFSKFSLVSEYAITLPKKKYITGSSYAGQWNLLEFHQHGVYRFIDGTTYEGKFKNGMFNGEGIFTYPDGLSFTAFFDNGELIEDSVTLNIPGLDNADIKKFYSENDRREEVLQSKVTRIPDAEEMAWIKYHCRTGGKVSTEYKPEYYPYFSSGRRHEKLKTYQIEEEKVENESKKSEESSEKTSRYDGSSFRFSCGSTDTDVKLKSKIVNDEMVDIETNFWTSFAHNMNKSFKVEKTPEEVERSSMKQILAQEEIRNKLMEENETIRLKNILEYTEEEKVQKFVESFRQRGFMENDFPNQEYTAYPKNQVSNFKSRNFQMPIIVEPLSPIESSKVSYARQSDIMYKSLEEKEHKKDLPFIKWEEIVHNMVPTKIISKKYETVPQPENENENEEKRHLIYDR